jgi:hypothetical protein
MNKEQQNDFWAFKTVSDEDRSYISINGYNDDLSSRYEYDSNVANCKQVKQGDVAILVNKKNILGFAKIADIETAKAQKEIRKCPICKTTNFEPRKNKQPLYRCNKGHEFEQYVSTIVDVTIYKSSYGDSFIPVRKVMPLTILKPFYSKGYNRNMSIQNVSKTLFEKKFPEVLDALNKTTTVLKPVDAMSPGDEDAAYIPNNHDEREKIQRQIRARRGQAKFRNGLRYRYGNVCMITGCTMLDIIEAAHINPYKGEKDNDLRNGILLRADIHTLFDLNLIGIEPNSLVVHVSEQARNNGYEHLHLTQLKACTASVRPSVQSLAKRWKGFNSLI